MSDLSKVDANQALMLAFNEATGRLKVESSATAPDSATEVIISHTDDSIKIGDGTNLLSINPDGSIKLPSGIATSAKQDTANTSLASVDGKTPALVSGRVPVDGSGVTQPVSGTVTVSDGGGSITVDGTVGVTGTFWQATQPVSIASMPATPVTDNGGSITVDGTFWQATQPVSAASLPLPSGAATSANQGTANASLASIDGKLTSPISVKGPDADTAPLTSNPIVIAGKASLGAGTYTVDAISTASGGTDGAGNPISALYVKDISGVIQQVVSGSLTSASFPLNLSSLGVNAVIIEVTGTWTGSIVPVAIAAGTVAVPMRILGTSTNVTSITSNGAYVLYGGGLEIIQIPGSGILTGAADVYAYTQSEISDVYTHISGTVPVSGTFWQATQPVSAASLPLPSGASTAANQTTGNNSLASIDTKTPALGQAAMAASSPVVIASNQSAVPVSGTFWQATQPVSGTFWQATQPVSAASLPLPSGAATAAKQPALGTAGTASADVLTVQGIASMTALKVDGSAVTQPVSGTVTVVLPQLTNMSAASNTPTGVVSLGNSLGKTNIGKTGSLVTTATTADQVILTYTVTAGKTFYMTYFDACARLTTFATTATHFGTVSLETPSGTKLYTCMVSGAGISAPSPGVFFSEPVPISAGTVIRLVCTPSAVTSYTWQANFGGYEK
jgi:hypothetical protein